MKRREFLLGVAAAAIAPALPALPVEQFVLRGPSVPPTFGFRFLAEECPILQRIVMDSERYRAALDQMIAELETRL